MSTILLEGFEQFNPSFNFSWVDLSEKLLALDPDETGIDQTAGLWFADGGTVNCVADEARISGKSLRFVRTGDDVATDGSVWDAVYGTNLGFGFKPRSDAAIGVGLKYSAKPLSAIPAIQFRYDAGEGEQEQVSIWISPSGKLFCSSVDYQTAISDQDPPVVIPELATVAGAFRFGVWNYVEANVVYPDGGTPVLTLAVNGTIVLDAEPSAALLKQTTGQTSSVHVINPPNTYFIDGYTQWVDDLYITERGTGILGPQQVYAIRVNALVNDEWGTGTLTSGDYAGDTNFVISTTFGEANEYTLEDLPVGVDSVTAASITLIATGNQASLSFGFIHPTTRETLKTRQGLDGVGVSEMLRFTSDTTLPGALDMDVAGVNGVQLFFQNLPFIG